MTTTFDFGKNHYGKNLLGPSTLARIACAPETWDEIFAFHHLLASDEYVRYVDTWCRESRKRFGASWWYLDIVNVVYAAAKVLQPKNYLEIGVRRGRSICTVARACPQTDLAAFDMWMEGYANMENPGKEFVAQELALHGHKGQLKFYDGDSAQTIPRYFAEHPGKTFDLITIDGDHSEEGAWRDIVNTIPHLAVGGVVIFDDISHPGAPHLYGVWQRAKQQFPWLATFEYTELGYGVGFGIRMS